MSGPGPRERMLGRLRAASLNAATAKQGSWYLEASGNAREARPGGAGELHGIAPVDARSNLALLDHRIDVHFARRRPQSAAAADPVATMQTALTASHATVWRAASDEWPEQLAQKLSEANIRHLLLDSARTEAAALKAALPAQLKTLDFDRPLEEWKSELFTGVDAGFTVARSGIAATGTLILAPDAGTPRTVSLVPPLHIALVYTSTLHADLHAAVHAERWAEGMPSNLVLVSGPSKTSDIQQTLAYGAHGPRWLWVIIVDDLAGGMR
ncbi:LUD domain-containing protein [Massilia sp. MB5]|uniref:LutC/YkgG family protein n=1 Tax=unclassified Massilia TaxID=2609279 RepID=UPI000AD01611|nr:MULTISPECIES: LUD domain-containing protein [unclassified Massilia]UMR29584.1 LUD domain-containing protein [Massilia sp. MB5]